jgi:integrase
MNEYNELRGCRDGDYIFGKALDASPIKCATNVPLNRLKDLCRDLLRKNQTLYSFKHTGVIAAYKAGIDLYSISRQCRHASLNQTMVYMRQLGIEPNVEFTSKMK